MLPVSLIEDQASSIVQSLAGIGTKDDEYLQDLEYISDTPQKYQYGDLPKCISKAEFHGELAI
jgi:hypothetical protein